MSNTIHSRRLIGGRHTMIMMLMLWLWTWRLIMSLSSSGGCGFPHVAAAAAVPVPLASSAAAEGEDEDEAEADPPIPRPWPHQFHSILFVNFTGSLSLIDLWYDWPNGRNFNIIRDQLQDSDSILYDLEWNNGTSFFYTLPDHHHPSSTPPSCRSAQLDVGILRPNWLDGASYLGQRHVDGFLCNVWEKLDFIWYYEDVVTKRPVHWLFYTGTLPNRTTSKLDSIMLPVSRFTTHAILTQLCFERQSTTQLLLCLICIQKHIYHPLCNILGPLPLPPSFFELLLTEVL
nr:uncharacterized protein At4g14100-like isoform X1 [Coffea arabica]